MAEHDSKRVAAARRAFRGAADLVRAREDPTLAARIVATQPLAGVSAGSALLRIGERLLAVQDDAYRASWIALPSLAVTSFVLAGSGAALPKLRKPDFEAAFRDGDRAVYLLGSGSLPHRCTLARIDLHDFAVSLRQRPKVFGCVREALRMRELPNIEGAIVDGDSLRLFHRGTGRSPSARIDVPLAVVLRNAPFRVIASQTFELGALDGVALAFTDAASITAERTAYVATAEQTDDAVADGPVAGSVIGLIEGGGARTAARWTRVTDADGRPTHDKIEGLVIDADLRGGWTLTDTDDPRLPTILGRLELRGFAA